MKKLFALLLALAMVLSLAACGGGDEKIPSNDDKTPSNSHQQEQNTLNPDEDEDEPDNTPAHNEGNADLEAPLYGWTEDDFKPDNIFGSIRYEEASGWYITTTEPLTIETYRAWYEKMFTKTEELADNGKYDMGNVEDINQLVSAAENVFSQGWGAMDLTWRYSVGGVELAVSTRVLSLEDTEDVIWICISEKE